MSFILQMRNRGLPAAPRRTREGPISQSPGPAGGSTTRLLRLALTSTIAGIPSELSQGWRGRVGRRTRGLPGRRSAAHGTGAPAQACGEGVGRHLSLPLDTRPSRPHHNHEGCAVQGPSACLPRVAGRRLLSNGDGFLPKSRRPQFSPTKGVRPEPKPFVPRKAGLGFSDLRVSSS